MAKSTWTSRLSQVQQSLENCGPAPIVNIDGPYPIYYLGYAWRLDKIDIDLIDKRYGKPPSFSAHENIILVAGGIGITPVISILKDLYNHYKQNHPKTNHIKNVSFNIVINFINKIFDHINIFLMWVVKDVFILEIFRDIFQDIYI